MTVMTFGDTQTFSMSRNIYDDMISDSLHYKSRFSPLKYCMFLTVAGTKQNCSVVF